MFKWLSGRMHLEVTVALAIACLAGVVGAATLASLSPLDQYSPQHEGYPLEPREIPEHPNWKENEDDAGIDSMVQSAHFRNGMKIDFIATPEDRELNVDELAEENERTLSAEEDDFVGDDNFQDQGPGSVEVYKLDLARDKPLLSPPIPKMPFFRSKSKTPKKASFNETSWKPKNIPESKILNPKIFVEPPYEQFGIGGVPELQVGCEGLEASYRSKRSSERKEGRIRDENEMNPMSPVTALDLDLNYDSYEDEGYEDELVKIKMAESSTNSPSNKKNRGDIEPGLADLGGRRPRPENLPNRGDLGPVSGAFLESINAIDSKGTNAAQSQGAARTENPYNAPVSRQQGLSPVEGPSGYSGGSRKLLSVESDDEKDLLEEDYPKRVEREVLWGFDEDEGAITSKELEIRKRKKKENEFRKREHESRMEETALRHRENRTDHGPAREKKRLQTTGEVSNSRQTYDRALERQRRRHRDKAREREDQERRRASDRLSEEKRRREEEDARMEARRKWQEEKRGDEETRAQREGTTERGRVEEEERRRQEAESRKEGPSNLVRSASRESEERRERKLREYVRKNTPMIVDARRQKEKDRQEAEEQRLQEYIRRMQPVDVSGRDSSRLAQEYQERKRIADARTYQPNYPTNGRRSHGPSAPTNVPSRASSNQVQRRQEARRLEEERRRIERQRFLEENESRMARRREEARRRYEEDRKRLEAARAQEERRRQEGISERTVQGRGRGREPSEAPANSILTRGRSAQELGRRRLEDYESRVKEEIRMNSLPVRARVIIRPSTEAASNSPRISSRNNFENGIDFQGINPNRQGLEAARFPVPATIRPPVKSPSPCVWAILQCCPSNNRLTSCFESMGCPGVNWDPNPCRGSIIQDAHSEIMKFYELENRH
ncbi:zinc finger CCCH domain-containing protein 13 isoform X2 [Cephus cinctus]|uniref:Zinc finger CCCH domain-containing protein 13 isoform X2 n=1 Tax=Cephus cinctus TaxID=211228 RepID=A0AAJ7C8A4_CEPCN|nr:zinc finger CCCH domain-containing protein 13 isoform X2 [Cephus cinctus]